jgi:hypothetical protein
MNELLLQLCSNLFLLYMYSRLFNLMIHWNDRPLANMCLNVSVMLCSVNISVLAWSSRWSTSVLAWFSHWDEAVHAILFDLLNWPQTCNSNLYLSKFVTVTSLFKTNEKVIRPKPASHRNFKKSPLSPHIENNECNVSQSHGPWCRTFNMTRDTY